MSKSTMLTLFACIIFIAGIAPARDLSVEQGQLLQVAWIENEPDGFSVSLDVAQPSWHRVEKSFKQLWTVEISNGGILSEVGKPQVPTAGRLFRLSPTGNPVVEIISVDYEVIEGIDVAAFIGTDDDLDSGPDCNELGSVAEPLDEWYPGSWAEVGEPAIMHDFRVSTMTTFPVQVNPARQEARVASKLQVRIHFEESDNRNTLPVQPTSISKAFLPFYRQFLDWDDSELDEYTLYRGGVQVIMRDDEDLMELMQPWFEWKLQKGWDLELLTDSQVNWNSGSIRGELRDRWDEAETKFDYIVVVGDDEGEYSVPPGTGAGNGAGDQGYMTLSGNDNFPDVATGRISIQNDTQLTTYINKVLAYEQNPDMDNTDWYSHGMVSVSDNHNPIAGKVNTMRYIRRQMLQIGYTQVDTSWHQGNNTAIQKINDGVSAYFARGYMGSGIPTGQIANLDNDFMTPVVIDVAEGTGNWSERLGINEAYMLAGTLQTPRGAIGAMGMATSGSRPNYNNLATDGGAWALLQLYQPCMGDMLLAGKINLWINMFEFDQNRTNNHIQWFNLMGDPTVWIWTGVPKILDVTTEEEISLGENSHYVLVEDDDTGEALSDAWVTFYKVDDNEEIIVKGETDENGEIILNAPIRYSGEATLSITKQHYAPVQIDVEAISPNNRIGFINVEYIDDGNNGTDGNSNGIPEAGETVGLRFSLKNYGDNTESGIELTLTTEETWINEIEGEVTLNNLLSGQSNWGTGLKLVEIAPEAQHDWIMHFDLNITSDQGGDYEDELIFTVASVKHRILSANLEDGVQPGDISDLEIEIVKTVGNNTENVAGELVSNDLLLRVREEEADFGEMSWGDTTTALFEVRLHSESIPGYPAQLFLVLTTESGNLDTVTFQLPLGEKESSDPCGPDYYGYYAFDNTDTTWGDICPEFDWIEINPDADDPDFEGEELPINDTGQSQDESCVIELPFTVQYYGEEFDSLTVCSNGWVAMGSQADMVNPRNWIIPSPLGPDNMIALFWDDLRYVNDTGIYSYHDEDTGRFIVEWYDIDVSGGGSNRFEVIFYSQLMRPTYSGDNDILFQYDDVHPSSNSMTYDTPYWTTGLENGSQTEGLLYAFGDEYSSGAAEIDDELSILFSTNVSLITGYIEGIVTDIATGEPLPDVEVEIERLRYSTATNDSGYYEFLDVPVGEYQLWIDSECYLEFISDSILVEDSLTTTLDAALRHSEIVLEPDEIELTSGNEEVSEINISNNGNGILEYSANIYLDDPRDRPDQTDTSWNSLYAFDLSPDESGYFGIVFVDRDYFISGSDNMDPTGPNKIYKYDDLGRELLATYDQPVPEEDRTATGMRGLAWDGEYLYGVDDEVIYQMEIRRNSIILADSWEAPLESAHFLEWDPVNDLFWMGDYNSDIYGINRDGEVIQRIEREFIPRGAAWNPNDESGRNLYIFTQLTSRSNIRVVRMNPESGESNIVHTIPYIAGRWALSGVDFSSTWNPLVNVFSAVINQTEESFVQVWYFSDNETFFSINNSDGTVNGGEENIIEFIFRSTGLPAGSYSFFVGFDNNACEDENNYIPITLTLPEIPDVIGDPYVEQPLEWSFDGAHPNPFNQTLTVRFALKEAVNVKVRIYNLLGQEVAALADESMTAGRYALPFDGSGLSSGMYFLQFNAGPLHITKKVVLLK